MHNNYHSHYIPNRGPKSQNSQKAMIITCIMHFENISTVGIKLLLEKISFYFRKFAISADIISKTHHRQQYLKLRT